MNTPAKIPLAGAGPLADQLADWMISQIEPAEGGRLDFQGWLVLVPTRNAGRLLRQQLAAKAAEQGRAVLAPKTSTPGVLLSSLHSEKVATPFEWRVAWLLALAEASSLPQLFPEEEASGLSPRRRQIARLAEMFVSLCDELAEAGLDPAASAPNLLTETIARLASDETERWAQVATLARLAQKRLSDIGLEPPTSSRIRLAAGMENPPERIILAGLPSFPAVVARMLENLPASTRIDVLIYAPGFSEQETAAFDELGRPRPEFWCATHLPLCAEQIALADDPVQMADAIADRLAAASQTGTPPEIALCDPALGTVLAARIERAGAPCFDPAGLPASRSPALQALGLLAALHSDRSLRNLAAAARHPAILERLAGLSQLPPGRFLATLDEMANDRVPVDLKAAIFAASQKFPQLAEALKHLDDLLENSPSISAWIEWVWPSGKARLEAGEIELLRNLLDLVDSCRVDVKDVPPAALFSAALGAVSGRRIDSARPDGPFIELGGWLEAAWLPGNSLLIVGANDGALPDKVDAHPFLPDKLKEHLGLQTNAMRHARDAALLRQIIGKCNGGSLELHLSKVSPHGDPWLPSRLLLQVPKSGLVGRFKLLFREARPPASTPPKMAAWRLNIPSGETPQKLRVTAFRDFLSDPLLYYFRHVLEMTGPFDPAPIEAPAEVIGSLFHRVMDDFAKDAAAAELMGEDEIIKWLESRTLDLVRQHFGGSTSLAVMIQIENLKRRMRAVAGIEAKSRAEGWRINHSEFIIPDGSLSIGGLPVSGRIDRIDCQANSGKIRIIDYKTGRGSSPKKTHFKKLAEEEPWPDWCRVPDGGARDEKNRRWADLQLPLYAQAAVNAGLAADVTMIETCYFNATAEPSETKIEQLALDKDLLDSALDCAAGIVETIRRGDFLFLWKHGKARDFDELLLRDLPGRELALAPRPATTEKQTLLAL